MLQTATTSVWGVIRWNLCCSVRYQKQSVPFQDLGTSEETGLYITAFTVQAAIGILREVA